MRREADVAQGLKPIFNKRASERLQTPDDLDRYVRVTTPSVWVALVAVFALIAGMLSWGLFGSVSTDINVTGASAQPGKVICMLDVDTVADVKVGDVAYAGNHETKVADISSLPLSRDETDKLFTSDYLVDAIMPGEWGYVVTLDVPSDVPVEVPLSVKITTEKVSPISLVLG